MQIDKVNPGKWSAEANQSFFSVSDCFEHSHLVQNPKSFIHSSVLNSYFRKKGTMLEKLNTEQQKTVKNIIGKVDKLPYVLFGPPGRSITMILWSFLTFI